MRTIALFNQKGGVGKTTSALNIAAGLARLGHKVAAVDVDPQGHLTLALGLDVASELANFGLPAYLAGHIPAKDAARDKGNMRVVACSAELALVESRLTPAKGRDLFTELFSSLDDCDYVVCDCPPNLGTLSLSCLAAAGEVLVPVQAEFLALQGLAHLQSSMLGLRQSLSPNCHISGVFVTRFNQRRRLHREVASIIKTHFPELLMQTKIREAVALAESPGFASDIFTYARQSAASRDYAALCKEIESLGVTS